MKKIALMISIFFIGINTIFAKEIVKYAACVDGDTIKVYLKNKEETVRLLAIDTPESVKPDTEIAYYGKEASEYTCNKIMNAKKIELEYDQKSDKRDKYDRILAWVFVDGSLLQSDLVELGYAKVVYLYKEYKYADILKEKQEIASVQNIGIWNTEAEKKYKKHLSSDTLDDDEVYSNIEVIVLTILFLIFILISKNTLKKKK